MANDDELAEQMPPPKRRAPLLQEWSETVEKLTLLTEAVRENTAVIARTRAPKALPRPVTAWDRLKAKLKRQKHDYIVSLVQPKPGKSTMDDGPVTDDLHSLTRGR